MRIPKQKLAYSKKGPKWGELNIKNAENILFSDTGSLRQSYYNKKKNYDLYADILDPKDIEAVCSQPGLELSDFPATMQNYALANPKIKLLLGEEAKRLFEFRVMSTNYDTQNKKEEEIKKLLYELIAEELQAEKSDEKAFQEKLMQAQAYLKYDYQDIREKMAQDILSYFYQEQGLKLVFNKGFEDALIAGEEVYRIDIEGGQPRVVKCNPLSLHVFGMGNSCFIEDADIIIEEEYCSLGQIVDEFHEDLNSTEIDSLESLIGGSEMPGDISPNMISLDFDTPSMSNSLWLGSDGTFDTNDFSNGLTNAVTDGNGNIRVLRVSWKSKRKVAEVTSIDEFGVTRKFFADENYVPNKLLGETVKYIWPNEGWRGYKIGKDIYKRIAPNEVQFNELNNISRCNLGYIGTIYNTNTSQARSLFDSLKSYQYKYNIYNYKEELAFAQWIRPMIAINGMLKPEDWTFQDWIATGQKTGFLIQDPTTEAHKGKATGRLAGEFNTMLTQMIGDNGALYSYIQALGEAKRECERMMGVISGVTDQRQGQVETREAVNNVERTITQSSHITEPWFMYHEDTKLRVLSALLEVAKHCFKYETDLRFQYILDDQSIKMIKIDGKLLAESTYAIFTVNSSKALEIENMIQSLYQAAVQAGTPLSTLLKTMRANGPAAMIKIVEADEEKSARRQAEAEEAQREHEAKLAEQQKALQQEALDIEKENREDAQMHDIFKLRVQGSEDRETTAHEFLLKAQSENNDKLTELSNKLMMHERELRESMLIEHKKLTEEKRQFDEKLKLEKTKLKQEKELGLKEIQVKKIQKRNTTK